MLADDAGSSGAIVAGIEVSPEALNELRMTDEQMETTTKWLSKPEERAAQLFLQKIWHFSGTTGSTTTAQVGKSWPSASLQKGLVEQMKKWQEKRQYKFRSDLLFRWAQNLEEEEKLNITQNGKSTSRFLLQPKIGVLVDEVPESEFEGHFDGSEEVDSSTEEKGTPNNQPEKKTTKKDHRSQKKRKLTEPDVPKSNKRVRREEGGAKYSSEEGMMAVSNWRNRVHCDKERFEQISSDIFHGTKEIGLIFNELLSQNQQAEITINELLKQMRELNARKESDWKLICSLREEVARLQKRQPWSRQVGSLTNSDDEEFSDGSLTDYHDRDFQLTPEYPPYKLRRVDDQTDQHPKPKMKYKPKQEPKYQPPSPQHSLPSTQQHPKKQIQVERPHEAPFTITTLQHIQPQFAHATLQQYPVTTQLANATTTPAQQVTQLTSTGEDIMMELVSQPTG